MAVLSKKLPAPTNVGPGKVASFNIQPGPVMEKFLIQMDKLLDGQPVTEQWLKDNVKSITLTLSPNEGSPIELIKDVPGKIWIELMNNYQKRNVQPGVLLIDFKRINQLTPQGQDRFLLVTNGLATINLEIELASGADEVKMYGEIVHRGYKQDLTFFSPTSAVTIVEVNRLGQKLAGEFTNTDIPCSPTRGDLLALHIACEDKLKDLKVSRDQIQHFNFSSPTIMKQFTESTGTRAVQTGYFHVDIEGMNNRYGEALNLSEAGEVRLEGTLSDTVSNFDFVTVRGVSAIALKS